MPVSLSRRIRRIGILPTTYKEVKETVLSKNEEGVEVPTERVKKVPQRHFSRMSAASKADIAAALVAEAKAKRVAAKRPLTAEEKNAAAAAAIVLNKGGR